MPNYPTQAKVRLEWATRQNAYNGSCPAPSFSFSGANNRLDGYIYDAAGNLMNDGSHAYTYDAEGRLRTVDGTAASYVYDAVGRRAQTTTGTTAFQYIYDQAGRATTELYSGGWIWGELFAGGMHVATYNGSTTTFDHTDWLGTARARSNVSGAAVETCTSLSFGDARNCGTGTDWSLLHFTGDMHDSESNLEHTLFRQYNSTEGRWTSPDPLGAGGADPGSPQSWNLYAYAQNNPISNVDPLGLYCETDGIDLFCDGSGFDMNPSPEQIDGGFTLQGMGIFPGEDSLNWPLGKNPTEILREILSGNLAGALGLDTSNCNPICDLDRGQDERIMDLAAGIAQRGGGATNPCFWGSWAKDAVEAGVGGGVMKKIATGTELAEIPVVQKTIAGVGLADKGKGLLGPFASEILKPVNNWYEGKVNKFCQWLGNL